MRHKSTYRPAPVPVPPPPFKPPCPACGSKSWYFRTKTRDFVCKHCGHAWKLENE